MKRALPIALLFAALGLTPALADDTPRPVDAAVAQSLDGGTMTRADPDMQLVLKALAGMNAPPVSTRSVAQARTQKTMFDALRTATTDKTGEPLLPEKVARTDKIRVAGAGGPLDARVYWPLGYHDPDLLPMIVYWHGGGWVTGDMDTYDASARALTNEAKAVVISVNYRQGPDDKFPAAHDDATAVYKDIVARAKQWRGDTTHIALVGEDAGANLALNVAIAARDQKLQAPVGVVAVTPYANGTVDGQSATDNAKAIPLGTADAQWYLANYLASPDQAKDPRIDLVDANLAGLAPVTIIGAEIDPLLDQGTALRDKLKAAGNDVAYEEWNGVTHEFFGMAGIVADAKAAQDFAGARIRTAFYGKP